MSISVKGIVFTPESGITEAIAGVNFEGIAIVTVHFGEDHAVFIAESSSGAETAANQINQALADGEGGTTEVTIIDDF
jgi:hypothetical protein